MPAFRQAAVDKVEWYPTKYDSCTIHMTGNTYRGQQGSGRTAILAMAKEGMTLGQVTREAADAGFDPNFTVGSIFKHINHATRWFDVVPPEGKTLAEIKAQREPRKVSPEAQAKREAAAQARLQRAEARAAAKLARDAERAEKKAAAKAAREAAKAAEPKAAEPKKAAPKKVVKRGAAA